tara:strand:- start:346 stop:585 length:240 start_codon:yes stop_codon:yes gene_type:complete
MKKIKIEDRRKQNIEVEEICLAEIRNLLIECLNGQEEIKKLISSGVVQQSDKYTCECKVCGKPFGDELSLYEHYDKEHN